MWPAFWLAAFMSVALSLLLGTVNHDQAPLENPVRALAPSMLQHHQAATIYAIANPSFTGPISAGALTFPTWYQSPGYWQSTVSSSGMVVTYAASGIPSGSTGAFVDGLIHASDASVGVGRSSGGYVQSAAGRVVALPSGIPNNVPVAATKVR